MPKRKHPQPKHSKKSLPADTLSSSGGSQQISELSNAEIESIEAVFQSLRQADKDGDGIISKSEVKAALMTPEARARVMLSGNLVDFEQLDAALSCGWWSPVAGLLNPRAKMVGDVIGSLPPTVVSTLMDFANSKEKVAYEAIPDAMPPVYPEIVGRVRTDKEKAFLLHIQKHPELLKDMPRMESLDYADVCDVLHYVSGKTVAPVKQACSPRSNTPCK